MTRLLATVLTGLFTLPLVAEVTHPVYAPAISASAIATLKSRVAELMAMSDQQLRDFVPRVNGFIFCGCPNCTMGTQEGQISWKGMADPDKAYCRFCKTEYPNPRFPEDKTIVGTNFKGEQVTYHYYEDPQGGKHYFTGRIAYDKKHWLGDRSLDLAQLYALTQDPAYSRKAVVLMDALADAYSHWCVNHDLCFGKKEPVEPKPPFPYWGGIWDRWFYCDVPINVVRAYDLVAGSGEVEKLSAELGVDVRKRTEDDFFRFSIWFVRQYEETVSNMSPGIYQGMIVVGRVLGDPDYVHDGVDRFRALVASKFWYDGFWQEGSISYHDQSIGWLKQVADDAQGYSDPEGYTSPRDNQHLAKLDLMGDYPVARKALEMDKRFVYPDGHIIPCHDAWAKAQMEPLAKSEPWLLPGMGHAILGCGEGAGQTQAQLHFSGGWGHEHCDNLTLTLFAEGRELISDLGYTHTKYRSWATSTPAHSTVAVDEQDHATSHQRCSLLLWEPKAGPAQVVEAESRLSYPGKVQEFRRLVALVSVDAAHAYALDIFRVKGGERHDWFLHGNADLDQTVELGLPTMPRPDSLLGPGVEFALPTLGETDSGKAPAGRNIGYGFIHSLRAAASDDTVSATYRFTSEPGPMCTTTVLGQRGTEYVLGEAPSIRRAGEDDQKLEQFMRPVLVARRQGAGLESVFIAVHRGWQGEDFVKRVTALPGLVPDPGATAVVVEHSRGKDILFACTEDGATRGVRVEGRDAPVCDARFALLRYDGEGKLVAQALVGGTRLEWDGAAIHSAGPLSGKVTGLCTRPDRTTEFGLQVANTLPAGTELVGRTVRITHPDGTVTAHTVTAQEAQGAGSVLWLEGDPGFRIEGGKTKFISFPQRELQGETAWRVENLVTIGR